MAIYMYYVFSMLCTYVFTMDGMYDVYMHVNTVVYGTCIIG